MTDAPSGTTPTDKVIENILQLTRGSIGRDDWKHDGALEPNAGDKSWKCSTFVYYILEKAGAYVPRWLRLSPRHPMTPPLAGEWGNPNVSIPGWIIVGDPQPGDVVAKQHNYTDASGHVAIVTGSNTTIYTDKFKVVEGSFGFRHEDKGTVVFSRYVEWPDVL
jgi:cell wall-associated NlpC family hydrolase